MLAEKQELNDEFMRKELNKIVSNSVGYNHINRFFTVSFLLFILLLSISLILYEFYYFSSSNILKVTIEKWKLITMITVFSYLASFIACANFYFVFKNVNKEKLLKSIKESSLTDMQKKIAIKKLTHNKGNYLIMSDVFKILHSAIDFKIK